MSKLLSFFLLFVLAFSAFTYAGQSDSGDGYRLQFTNDANGGAGLAGKKAQRGMDGCPGGTSPSSDGSTISPVHMRNAIPGIRAPRTRTVVYPWRRIMKGPEVVQC